eukprot:g2824.t1
MPLAASALSSSWQPEPTPPSSLSLNPSPATTASPGTAVGAAAAGTPGVDVGAAPPLNIGGGPCASTSASSSSNNIRTATGGEASWADLWTNFVEAEEAAAAAGPDHEARKQTVIKNGKAKGKNITWVNPRGPYAKPSDKSASHGAGKMVSHAGGKKGGGDKNDFGAAAEAKNGIGTAMTSSSARFNTDKGPPPSGVGPTVVTKAKGGGSSFKGDGKEGGTGKTPEGTSPDNIAEAGREKAARKNVTARVAMLVEKIWEETRSARPEHGLSMPGKWDLNDPDVKAAVGIVKEMKKSDSLQPQRSEGASTSAAKGSSLTVLRKPATQGKAAAAGEPENTTQNQAEQEQVRQTAGAEQQVETTKQKSHNMAAVGKAVERDMKGGDENEKDNTKKKANESDSKADELASVVALFGADYVAKLEGTRRTQKGLRPRGRRPKEVPPSYDAEAAARIREEILDAEAAGSLRTEYNREADDGSFYAAAAAAYQKWRAVWDLVYSCVGEKKIEDQKESGNQIQDHVMDTSAGVPTAVENKGGRKARKMLPPKLPPPSKVPQRGEKQLKPSNPPPDAAGGSFVQAPDEGFTDGDPGQPGRVDPLDDRVRRETKSLQILAQQTSNKHRSRGGQRGELSAPPWLESELKRLLCVLLSDLVLQRFWFGPIHQIYSFPASCSLAPEKIHLFEHSGKKWRVDGEAHLQDLGELLCDLSDDQLQSDARDAALGALRRGMWRRSAAELKKSLSAATLMGAATLSAATLGTTARAPEPSDTTALSFIPPSESVSVTDEELLQIMRRRARNFVEQQRRNFRGRRSSSEARAKIPESRKRKRKQPGKVPREADDGVEGRVVVPPEDYVDESLRPPVQQLSDAEKNIDLPNPLTPYPGDFCFLPVVPARPHLYLSKHFREAASQGGGLDSNKWIKGIEEALTIRSYRFYLLRENLESLGHVIFNTYCKSAKECYAFVCRFGGKRLPRHRDQRDPTSSLQAQIPLPLQPPLSGGNSALVASASVSFPLALTRGQQEAACRVMKFLHSEYLRPAKELSLAHRIASYTRKNARHGTRKPKPCECPACAVGPARPLAPAVSVGGAAAGGAGALSCPLAAGEVVAGGNREYGATQDGVKTANAEESGTRTSSAKGKTTAALLDSDAEVCEQPSSQVVQVPRAKGRPKGAKNKPKPGAAGAAAAGGGAEVKKVAEMKEGKGGPDPPKEGISSSSAGGVRARRAAASAGAGEKSMKKDDVFKVEVPLPAPSEKKAAAARTSKPKAKQDDEPAAASAEAGEPPVDALSVCSSSSSSPARAGDRVLPAVLPKNAGAPSTSAAIPIPAAITTSKIRPEQSQSHSHQHLPAGFPTATTAARPTIPPLTSKDIARVIEERTPARGATWNTAMGANASKEEIERQLPFFLTAGCYELIAHFPGSANNGETERETHENMVKQLCPRTNQLERAVRYKGDDPRQEAVAPDLGDDPVDVPELTRQVSSASVASAASSSIPGAASVASASVSHSRDLHRSKPPETRPAGGKNSQNAVCISRPTEEATSSTEATIIGTAHPELILAGGVCSISDLCVPHHLDNFLSCSDEDAEQVFHQVTRANVHSRVYLDDLWELHKTLLCAQTPTADEQYATYRTGLAEVPTRLKEIDLGSALAYGHVGRQVALSPLENVLNKCTLPCAIGRVREFTEVIRSVMAKDLEGPNEKTPPPVGLSGVLAQEPPREDVRVMNNMHAVDNDKRTRPAGPPPPPPTKRAYATIYARPACHHVPNWTLRCDACARPVDGPATGEPTDPKATIRCCAAGCPRMFHRSCAGKSFSQPETRELWICGKCKTAGPISAFDRAMLQRGKWIPSAPNVHWEPCGNRAKLVLKADSGLSEEEESNRNDRKTARENQHERKRELAKTVKKGKGFEKKKGNFKYNLEVLARFRDRRAGPHHAATRWKRVIPSAMQDRDVQEQASTARTIKTGEMISNGSRATPSTRKAQMFVVSEEPDSADAQPSSQLGSSTEANYSKLAAHSAADSAGGGEPVSSCSSSSSSSTSVVSSSASTGGGTTQVQPGPTSSTTTTTSGGHRYMTRAKVREEMRRAEEEERRQEEELEHQQSAKVTVVAESGPTSSTSSALEGDEELHAVKNKMLAKSGEISSAAKSSAQNQIEREARVLLPPRPLYLPEVELFPQSVIGGTVRNPYDEVTTGFSYINATAVGVRMVQEEFGQWVKEVKPAEEGVDDLQEDGTTGQRQPRTGAAASSSTSSLETRGPVVSDEDPPRKKQRVVDDERDAVGDTEGAEENSATPSQNLPPLPTLKQCLDSPYLFHRIPGGHVWQKARIAILDVDVHHGNGTQEVFYDDPDVLFASLHRGALHCEWKSTSDYCGTGKGLGKNLNLPLLRYDDDDVCLAYMNYIVMPVLAQFRPELIVVSLGFDALNVWNDNFAGHTIHAGGCDCSFSPMVVYGHIIRRLQLLCPRIVLHSEGGYDPFQCGEAAKHSLRALLGQPLDMWRMTGSRKNPQYVCSEEVAAPGAPGATEEDTTRVVTGEEDTTTTTTTQLHQQMKSDRLAARVAAWERRHNGLQARLLSFAMHFARFGWVFDVEAIEKACKRDSETGRLEAVDWAE